jgi:hypothetical protein
MLWLGPTQPHQQQPKRGDCHAIYVPLCTQISPKCFIIRCTAIHGFKYVQLLAKELNKDPTRLIAAPIVNASQAASLSTAAIPSTVKHHGRFSCRGGSSSSVIVSFCVCLSSRRQCLPNSHKHQKHCLAATTARMSRPLARASQAQADHVDEH